MNYEETKSKLAEAGVSAKHIISLKEYKKKLGFFGSIYCYVRFVPSMIKRMWKYVKRNGIKGTVNKLKSRF